MDIKRECPLCGLNINDHKTTMIGDDEAYLCNEADDGEDVRKKVLNWIDNVRDKRELL